MKVIKTVKSITYPESVTVTIKARVVTVRGPRGTLKRSFKHVTMDLSVRKEKREISLVVWFGKKDHLACIRTVMSHIQNMITGVTKGFEFKMRFVYAHFPINVSVLADGRTVEVRNFLGEKRIRTVVCPEGIKVVRSEKVKDEIVLVGNDLEALSLSAARIHQSCAVKVKDIRKFLDGIYVSERNVLGE